MLPMAIFSHFSQQTANRHLARLTVQMMHLAVIVQLFGCDIAICSQFRIARLVQDTRIGFFLLYAPPFAYCFVQNRGNRVVNFYSMMRRNGPMQGRRLILLYLTGFPLLHNIEPLSGSVRQSLCPELLPVTAPSASPFAIPHALRFHKF